MRTAPAVLFVLLLGSLARAAGTDLPTSPLTLGDCLALARRHNPSLVIAQQDVVTARAGLQQAYSGYLPSVSLSASRGRSGGQAYLDTSAGTIPFSTAGERREVDLALSHTLWRLGRTESVRGARASLAASQDREQTRNHDIALAVSQQYYAALAAEQLVSVAEATLASARNHEMLVRARVVVGEGAKVDVAPAEAEVADGEYQLLQARNQAALAKAVLKREMGVPPTYQVQLAPPDLSDEGDLPTLEEALELARQHRPELRGGEHAMEASRQNVRLAKLLSLGAIGITTEYDRGLSGTREGGSWAALLSLTTVLFDGGARQAEVAAAEAGLTSLGAQQKQVLDSIGWEVESARLQWGTARQSVHAAQKAQTAAEAQLAAAEGKYRAGVGIFVEIQDAQRALMQARTHAVGAQYDCQTARAALRRATGQLSLGEPQP